jgi:ABC-type branched-subunit amino acid transport system ATPase component
MSEFALEAVGLKKSFGALTVTDDVTLRFGAGSRTALIGPNGAGKTTLVGLLSGTLAADAGRITLRGRDVTREGPAARVKQGLVRTFQVSSLFAGLTVLENAFLAVSENAAASRDLWRPAGRRRALIEQAEDILERLHLSERRHHRVTEVPYGVQRLLEIALALALEPKVLLLDEPAAGIPASEVGVLLDAVQSLPQEIAILMIEHDMHVVRRFASEVHVLVHGRVMMTGPPAEVMASDEVRAVYLGQSGESRFAGGAHGA